ncbi:MAG: F0F1 ATP synthase subunit delta [Polyangiaceae bacterium]
MSDVARRLGGLTDEKAGIVRAGVVSAAPLSEDFYSRLAQKLEVPRTEGGHRARARSTIAGIVTRIGDNTIDGSLKGRLRSLERTLLQS